MSLDLDVILSASLEAHWELDRLDEVNLVVRHGPDRPAGRFGMKA